MPGKTLLLILGAALFIDGCLHAPISGSPDESALRPALGSGAAFVLARQDSDGAWRDYWIGQVGVSDQWVTAYVGKSLAITCGLLSDTTRGRCLAAVDRAKAFLDQNRYPQGGWGYNRNAGMDADSTAIALEFLEEKHTALLDRYRRADGGYATFNTQDAWGASHISITAQVLAIRDDSRAVEFLKDRMNPEGSWDDYWWVGKMYPIERAVNALVPYGMDLSQVSAWIRRSEHPGGGWSKPNATKPDPFETALAVLALQRLGKEPESTHRGIAWLVKQQKSHGSWSPSALLRVPRKDEKTPWEGEYTGITALDERALFTTATALRALATMVKQGGKP